MKNFLRRILSNYLKALPTSTEKYVEAAINHRLKNEVTRSNYQVVIGYSKFFRGEISLDTFYKFCLKAQLKLFLVPVEANCLIECFENKSTSSEVKLPLNSFSRFDGKVLILAPCLAVDLSGIRLGRGKGFYDSFFKSYPSATKIVVCYDFQIFKKLPKDPWDMAANFLVSESKLIPNLR
jgi:5,10-methenyltetrahydrofolate synthetase